MAKDMSPTAKGTKLGIIEGNQGNNSLINNGVSSVFNFVSFHSRAIVRDVEQHPEGTFVGEIQNRLHFHRGNTANYENRRLIAHDCVILTFFGFLRYDGKTRKYYPGKKSLAEPMPRPERVFGSDGLPRVTGTRRATMPGYGRPDCGGEGE
jgi:hypothetical protein